MTKDETMLYLMNEAEEEEDYLVQAVLTVNGEPFNLDFLMLVGESRDLFDEWAEDTDEAVENVYDGVMSALNDGADTNVLAGGTDDQKDDYVTDVKLGVLLRMYFGEQVDKHLPFTFEVHASPAKHLTPERYALLRGEVQ